MAQALGERPALAQALALAGAAFLAVYGWRALQRARQASTLDVTSLGQGMGRGSALAQAAAFTLLNPHVYLDTVLLLGSVGAQQPAGTQMAFLLGSGLSSVVWFAGLGFGARLLSPLFVRPQAWRVLDVVVGLTMAWIAYGLAAGAWRASAGN